MKPMTSGALDANAVINNPAKTPVSATAASSDDISRLASDTPSAPAPERRGIAGSPAKPPLIPCRAADAVCDEATITKPRPEAPRDAPLESVSADLLAEGARNAVKRSVQVAEAGSEQHVLAQAWLNEGGAVGSPEKLNPLRILVVENEAVIATLIAEPLDAVGHETCAIAATQEDAVAAAARYRPDLMLVDVHLGAGSGTGAVAEILLGCPVPHIFMTGDVLPGDQPDPKRDYAAKAVAGPSSGTRDRGHLRQPFDHWSQHEGFLLGSSAD